MRLFLYLILSLFAAAAHAGSGNFDSAFNGGAARVIDFSVLQADFSVRDVAMAVDAQERITVATVLTNTSLGDPGLGLARLLRDGRPDTSFGQQGVARIALPELYRVSAVEIDASGRAYVAMQLQLPDFSYSWRVCRLTAAGAIDSTFFGGNCANVVPHARAGLTDMVLTQAGNLWLVGGVELNLGGSVRRGMAVAQINTTAQLIHAEVLTMPGGHMYVGRASADVGESVLVAGGYSANGQADTDATYFYITRSGTNPFFFTQGPVVAFNRGGFNFDQSVCVQHATNGLPLVGANVEQNGGTLWASFRVDPTNALDPTYGSNGSTLDNIGNIVDYGREISMYDCAVGPDGALNLVGSYAYSTAQGNVRAMAVYRMKDGLRDSAFGGPGARPGTGRTPEVAGVGAAVHHFLPAARNDTAEAVIATVDGRLLIGGTSMRSGSGALDLVIAKLHGDSLFGDGFGGD